MKKKEGARNEGRGDKNPKRRGHVQRHCVLCIPESVGQTRRATQALYSTIVHAEYKNNGRNEGSKPNWSSDRHAMSILVTGLEREQR